MTKGIALLKTYLLLCVLFTTLLVVVFSIPTSWLRNHLLQSVETIQQEGIWPKVGGIYLLQIDNMTDCLMFNINACADSRHPVYAAMMNEYAQNYDDARYYLNMAETTQQVLEEGRDRMTGVYSYGRYWHGYQVVLRPLLLLFDYAKIRIINFLLLFSLAGYIFFLLYKREGRTIALVFLIALLLVAFPVVPTALQFSTTFYIAFLGMLWMMKSRWARKNEENVCLSFFVIGAFTSFMDFLTTPQITLGLPLTVWILDRKPVRKMMCVLKMSIYWFLGYASIWITKWFLAPLLTGESVMESVKENVALRLSHTVYYGGEPWQVGDFLKMIMEKVSVHPVFPFALILLLLLFSFCIYKVITHRTMIRQKGWLWMIFFLVPCWYLCLFNHSLQHVFFTWRALLVSVFAILLIPFIRSDHEKDCRTDTLLQ